MPLYDFKCPNGHVTEKLAPATVKNVPCPKCDRSARRVEISLPAGPNSTWSSWSK
jgi:putative FmdB family regulatory protein